MKIRLEGIIPDPDQPRKSFDEERATGLSNSLDSLGLIQPITVRPCGDGKYMVVVGERRLRAAQLSGQGEIECIVREDVDDRKTREMQFAENIHEDVPPLELGRAFYEHRKRYGMSQRQLAIIVGLSNQQVNRYEALHTALSPQVTQYVSSGKLDGRTAVEIASIREPSLQDSIAKAVVEKELGLHTTEKVVQMMRAAPNRSVEGVVAQVQYGIEREKANHRAVLDELRRQQRAEERLAVPPPDNGTVRRILLGDVTTWRDIGLDASCADAIITDPPYNRAFLPTFAALSEFAGFVLKDGGSLFAMVGQSYLPDVVSMLSQKLAYHWTLAYLTPGGQSPQLWDRKVNSFWKPVLWFVKGEYNGKWLGDVVKSEVNDNDKDFHEWGQSESGMADLIRRTTEEGDLILDPFSGGGTTGKVAVELNRGFIGIDNSQEAVDLTKRRLGVV